MTLSRLSAAIGVAMVFASLVGWSVRLEQLQKVTVEQADWIERLVAVAMNKD